MNVLKSILIGQIPLSRKLAEWIYQCSECGNCSEVCHMTHNENIILPTCNWIDHVKIWEALRRDLIQAGFAPLEEHEKLIKYMNNKTMENPYGENIELKFDWLAEFPEIEEKGNYAFFGGCTMPLRQKHTLRNMMKIFKLAGLTIAKPQEEWCCGSIGLRIGDKDSLMDIIQHNIEIIKNTEAKTLLTSCAGCYRTFKKDYPDLLGEELPFEVKHITEILKELINTGKIPFKAEGVEPLKVTYHDPCHLGRHMDLYEIPRNVIKKIPEVELIEMKRNRKNAWCCGAGGGLKSQFSELALEISKERVKEAMETGAEMLITSCPFCIGNLNDSLNKMDSEMRQKFRIIDIIDLIASRI